PTTGFGRTFNWSGNQLSHNETWGDFLRKELHLQAGLATLEKYEMLTPPRLKRLRTTLEGVAAWKPKPALNHGDLRLKNVIVDKAGKITAIIDWENCISSIAPHWELSLSLHDLSID